MGPASQFHRERFVRFIFAVIVNICCLIGFVIALVTIGGKDFAFICSVFPAVGFVFLVNQVYSDKEKTLLMANSASAASLREDVRLNEARIRSLFAIRDRLSVAFLGAFLAVSLIAEQRFLMFLMVFIVGVFSGILYFGITSIEEVVAEKHFGVKVERPYVRTKLVKKLDAFTGEVFHRRGSG